MAKIKKPQMHKEGTHLLVGGIILLTGICVALYWLFDSKIPFALVTATSAIVYLILFNFFRCPARTFIGTHEGAVVAPADGKIVVIEEVEENEYFHERKLMISIFMSVFNVHANWFPVDGKVVHVSHKNGKFAKAWLPKASTDNERSSVVVTTPKGTKVLARQIAGAMARRIVTYAKPNEICSIDEHMGFIKFGSRVDVYLPIGTEVCVEMGQCTVGGQTLIAKLNEK
jgi:phosphatidylserine decarboxylase